MGLSSMLKNSLLDYLDIPILLLAAAFLYLDYYYVAVPIQNAVADSFTTYLTTGSFLKASGSFASSLLNPIVFLALLLHIIILTYVSAFIVARIGQKRLKHTYNPVKRAVDRLVPVFIAYVVVGFLPFLSFVLFEVYYPLPIAWIFFWLAVLSLLTWSMLFLPYLATAVLVEGKGRHMLQEGLVAGRATWWRSLVTLLVVIIVVYAVSYLVSVFAPSAALFVFGLLSTISIPIVAAEAYVSFKEGA